MNTYQFYTLGKNKTARIKVSKMGVKDHDEQIDYNRVSVFGLGDWLYDNLTTSSITYLVGHIVKRYKESENAQSNTKKSQ